MVLIITEIEHLMRIFILAVVTGCLMVTSVSAEHEVDHRYNIRGYVLDESQRGIGDVNVQAFDGGSMLESIKTDSDGYYSLHLHLHNTDNRKILKLRAGSHEAELRVTFDPSDITTLRVHDANFVAGEFVEGELNRFRMPPWMYPVAGLLVLGVIVVLLEKRRKKKIRQKNIAAGEHHSPGHRKSKKRRKKKH
jgi:hypothetical protein